MERRYVVTNENGRQVITLVYRLQVVAQLLAQGGIQRRERLVQEQELRALYECTGECYPLLLTTGQLAGVLVRQIFQFHHDQELCDDTLGLTPPERIAQIAAHRHIGKESIVLKNKTYAAFAGAQEDAFLRVQPSLAGKVYPSPPRLEEAGKDAQQGRFARS
jgi:hypothetical protein